MCDLEIFLNQVDGWNAVTCGGDFLLVSSPLPLVVRLEGTNVELGRDIIRNSGLNVIAADDLSDAAQKIVKAVKG